MKEVILHIGLPKTGSTSIQSAIAGYSKNKIHTASFGVENHSIPIYTMFSSQRFKYHVWKNQSLTHNQIDKLRLDFLRVLEFELSCTKNETLLISGEDISRLTQQEISNMINYFNQRGIDVQIIAYVRNPINWITSIIQQFFRDGNDLVLSRGLFKDRLNPYFNLIKKGNIHVFSYEDAIGNHGSIVKHFAELLSLDLVENPNDNISFSPIQLALVAELNKVQLNVFSNKHRYRVRSNIIEKILTINIPITKFEKLDYRYFYNYLPKDIKSDCEWLNDNFNIKYEIPENKEVFVIEDYFKQILEESKDSLNDIFTEIGCNYNQSISLTNNFLEAYFTLGIDKILYDFSEERYLLLNPDVKISGINPFEHYLKYGINEGRKI
jgi:arsenate reductase-like glutaredoxin family protein